MGIMYSQIDLLHQTSKIVSSGLILDEMLKELIRLTAEVTACDACLVYLVALEGEIVLRAHNCRTPMKSAVSG
jgi:uroporphyrinogen-III synthase